MSIQFETFYAFGLAVMFRCRIQPVSLFRSFTIHLTDDHGVSEVESHERFAECSRKRREKTLQVIRQRHEDEEEARRQKQKSKKKTRETLEAYVTSHGELRVRAIKKDLGAETNVQQTEKTEMNGNINIWIVLSLQEFGDANFPSGLSIQKTFTH